MPKKKNNKNLCKKSWKENKLGTNGEQTYGSKYEGNVKELNYVRNWERNELV